jgi:hypothetical protein
MPLRYSEILVDSRLHHVCAERCHRVQVDEEHDSDANSHRFVRVSDSTLISTVMLTLLLKSP